LIIAKDFNPCAAPRTPEPGIHVSSLRQAATDDMKGLIAMANCLRGNSGCESAQKKYMRTAFRIAHCEASVGQRITMIFCTTSTST
jgi:hypothetical protein